MSKHFGGAGPLRHGGKSRVVAVAVAVAAFVVFSSVALLFLANGSSTASAPVTTVQDAASQVEMVEVLIPAAQIDAGAALEPSMFKKEQRPRVGVSPRAIKDFEEIKGYYARSLIIADQPLTKDYITEVKPSSVITANIPEGYRAVTINVDARSSVEGWARPGARVDVIWASRVRGQETVTVIVQNARILSAERMTENQGTNNNNPAKAVPNTVTLLVSAKDAQKIQLASTAGALSLSLRGDNDTGRGQASGSITIDELLGVNKNQGAVAAHEGTVKVKGPDGKFEEYVLRNGKLEPAASAQGAAK